ncbi:DUF3331 domain-containing protein [Paraburkholderia caledonica]|jgi:hypothetical protein|uniref:DUF3331 domain-containing protein n=1 Tax=Paraburkholderia caledonica TaxID=134536 RepID=UPI0038B71E59
MTLEASENIIEKALLSLLAPQSAPRSELTFVKKTRIRRRPVCQPTYESVVKELPPARISIVERRSPVTLSVCWSDATSGYFAEQVWRMGLAHFQSYCALSGVPINVGDSVFRPWISESRAQANSDRMILVSSVGVPAS